MPKKLPPHLPPPVCNIAEHKKWLRLKLILASAGFGLLAGLSGASILLGWIWPGYGGGDIWAVTEQNRSAISKSQLEEKIVKEIQDKIFTVYARSTTFNGNFYFKKTDKLGESIAISSDGWLVMYLPNYNGMYKNWRILSSDGNVYSLEKVVFDKYSGVAYLRLANTATAGQNSNQLKVVSFSDLPQTFDEIFVYHEGNWQKDSLSYPIYNQNSSHLDTAPNLLFKVSYEENIGSLVINNQGRVVGFITDQGALLPNIYLTRIMPELLNSHTVVYTSLGIEGWFGKEQPIVVNNEEVHGFAVNRVWASSSPLKKGDIITEINGKQIEDADYLWYSNKTITLKILRSGKVLQLESPIFQSTY